MELNEARKELLALQEKMSAYDHAMSLLSYDGETTAPRGTAPNRAHSMGILSEIMYTLSTGEETVALLEYLDENREQLDRREQRMVYLLLKDIRFMRKIPLEEYVAYEKLVVESQDVWRRAKENNDFASFAPYLEKILASRVRFARYAAPDTDPYDFWLNEFEPGVSRKTCDVFFAQLRERLVPLIRACQGRPQVSDDCIKGDFPEDGQRALAF